MNKSIEIIRNPRLNLLKFVNDLSIDQLNMIPNGFVNNIMWNLGHMISAQQDFFETFKSGSKPERLYTADDLKNIEELFTSTLDQLEADMENNIFVKYTPVTTRYGVELNGIEDAIKFLPFHEGLHLGYIFALRRAVLAS